MSTVHIELDLAVVQKAIHAKVAPAVDALLAKHDIPSLIEKELLKPSKDDSRDQSAIVYMMMSYGNSASGRPMIEAMISSAIREAAQAYVKRILKRDRAEIEEAFRKMLASSSDALARKFLAAAENAIGDEWQFNMETKVLPKPPERGSTDYEE